MNTESTVASRSDEVVFDNRNKLYGAYFIRRSYTSSLGKGSGGSFLVIGLFLAAVQGVMMMKPDVIKPLIGCRFPVVLDKNFIVIPEHPVEPQQIKAKQTTGFPTRVVVDEVETPIEDNTSATTVDDGAIGDFVPSDRIGVGPEVSTTSVVAEDPRTVDFAEVMPEFEGGQQAMYKFLQRHLRYPRADQRIGLQGKVFVRFVIDITGTVTAVEVIRGIGGSLDKEAMRVIALMPKWKPGSQHGNPVNVRMVLPIKFEMND